MIPLKKPHRLTTRFSFKPAALVSSNTQKSLQRNPQICISGLHKLLEINPSFVWSLDTHGQLVNLQTRIRTNLLLHVSYGKRGTGSKIMNYCIILPLCLLFALQIEVRPSLAVSNFLSESWHVCSVLHLSWENEKAESYTKPFGDVAWKQKVSNNIYHQEFEVT